MEKMGNKSGGKSDSRIATPHTERTPAQERAVKDAYYLNIAANIIDQHRNNDAVDVLVGQGYEHLPTFLRAMADRLRGETHREAWPEDDIPRAVARSSRRRHPDA